MGEHSLGYMPNGPTIRLFGNFRRRLLDATIGKFVGNRTFDNVRVGEHLLAELNTVQTGNNRSTGIRVIHEVRNLQSAI